MTIHTDQTVHDHKWQGVSRPKPNSMISRNNTVSMIVLLVTGEGYMMRIIDVEQSANVCREK